MMLGKPVSEMRIIEVIESDAGQGRIEKKPATEIEIVYK